MVLPAGAAAFANPPTKPAHSQPPQAEGGAAVVSNAPTSLPQQQAPNQMIRWLESQVEGAAAVWSNERALSLKEVLAEWSRADRNGEAALVELAAAATTPATPASEVATPPSLPQLLQVVGPFNGAELE